MKYRVPFEASATIGVEIKVEAEDEDAARHHANLMYDKGDFKLEDIVGDRLKPSKEAIIGYAEQLQMPYTYITAEEDENGFEIVDVFEPDDIVQ